MWRCLPESKVCTSEYPRHLSRAFFSHFFYVYVTRQQTGRTAYRQPFVRAKNVFPAKKIFTGSSSGYRQLNASHACPHTSYFSLFKYMRFPHSLSAARVFATPDEGKVSPELERKVCPMRHLPEDVSHIKDTIYPERLHSEKFSFMLQEYDSSWQSHGRLGFQTDCPRT